MHLYLEFNDGVVTGEGTDYVGPWTLVGQYDEANVTWIKQYVGKHSVSYSGNIDGDQIKGHWNIRDYSTGAFHIWPATRSDLTELYLREELDEQLSGTQLLGTVPVEDDPFV